MSADASPAKRRQQSRSGDQPKRNRGARSGGVELAWLWLNISRTRAGAMVPAAAPMRASGSGASLIVRWRATDRRAVALSHKPAWCPKERCSSRSTPNDFTNASALRQCRGQAGWDGDRATLGPTHRLFVDGPSFGFLAASMRNVVATVRFADMIMHELLHKSRRPVLCASIASHAALCVARAPPRSPALHNTQAPIGMIDSRGPI